MKSGEYLIADKAAVDESENSNPSTYSEALSSRESDLWLTAMKEEIDACMEMKHGN